MSKQVKLLATYPVPGGGYFSPGDIIWVDDPVAAQLIANQNATYDLSNGQVTFRPAAGNGVGTGTNLPSNQTIGANQVADVVVPAGVNLGLVSSGNIVGTWAVVNADGSTASPTALTAGMATVGVFLIDTRVRFAVSVGSVAVKPGVVAGSLASSPLYFVPIDPATGLPYKIQGGGNGTIDGAVTSNPALVTGIDASTTITTTSKVLIPANARWWEIAYDDVAEVYMRYGGAATAAIGGGNFKVRPGERRRSNVGDTRSVNVIVPSGTALITAWYSL